MSGILGWASDAVNDSSKNKTLANNLALKLSSGDAKTACGFPALLLCGKPGMQKKNNGRPNGARYSYNNRI